MKTSCLKQRLNTVTSAILSITFYVHSIFIMTQIENSKSIRLSIYFKLKLQ